MQKIVIDPAWSEQEKWAIMNRWIAELCDGGITRENIQSGAIVGGTPASGEPVPLALDTVQGENVAPEVLEARHLTQEFNEYINQAHANAEGALELAHGKNTVYRQTTEPTGGDYVAGDVWYKIDTADPPNVTGIYMYVGEAGWVLSPISGAVITAASIVASQLAANTITADSAAIFSLNASKIITGILASIEVQGVFGNFEYLYAGLEDAQGRWLLYDKDTPIDVWYDPNHAEARITKSQTDHVIGYGKIAPWESTDYIGMADYAG